METLKRIWPQLRVSPPAPLTATTIPSQAGKVFLITGSTAGVGLELTRILYNAGVTIYMAARSASKAATAITAIIKQPNTSGGSIHYLHLDLANLTTIKPFATAFLVAASRLDVLFNNAGVGNISADARTSQGLEPHMGINCVGPYLLTQLLAPLLIRTATMATTALNSVRVVWTSSMLVDVFAPPEGVPPTELDHPSTDPKRNYAISKAGNWFLAARLAAQLGPHGVVSLTQNPGNLRTAIWDATPRLAVWAVLPSLYRAVDGAHTALWAGLASEVTLCDGGRYVVPWGKWHPRPRRDLLGSMRDAEEGGRGFARGLEEWCEAITRGYR
ncbi:hypothetical protein MMC34_001354 [Xylographa carneopallida]|nr:hypothetical protein [Xylographa carneopallida]